ncbi:MAG: hypothetical protein RQ733_00935 [Methyloprofundus sp.]|nr:hypothetical protein [Methyloprofundus sp.]MDT8424518.1 hypothetical protein [Methyloprofundus sp.]
MFGGLLSILIAIWVYRTAVQAKTGKILFWTAGAAIMFFVVQILFYNFNIFILDTFDGSDIGGDYDRDLTSVSDRKDGGGIQEGFLGTVLGILFEILPLVMAWLSVALVRTKFMLKESINYANLVSGIKDMFIAIKNSFKTTD